MPDQTVTVSLRASIAQYLTSMGAASKATSAFRGSLMTLGMGMTKFVTLPVLAAGAGALKVAMDWESAFAGVRKTVEATEPQLAKLEAGLRSMARALPATHEEIAGVAEAAGQLGIALPRIESFTRTMIDLGVATNMSADQAATALARLANITQMPQSEFDRLGSTVVDLGNNLATTEAEIVQMGLRIAGAGAQVGLSEAQILGLAGALSSVGIRAEAGGSSVSRAMIDMAGAVRSGGEQLQEFSRVAGMSAGEFQRLFEQDAAAAITVFVEGLGRISEAGGDTFGILEKLGLSEIRVRDAMLRLSGAGDVLRTSLDLGTEAWRENNALTIEAERRYKTTESQLKVTVNQIKDLGITLGTQLLPHVQTVLGGIRDLLKGFTSLDPAMQGNIIKWGLIAAAAGPALMIFSKLIGVMGSLLTPMGLMKAGLGFIAFGLYDAYQNAKLLETGTTELAGKLMQGTISIEDMKAELAKLVAKQEDASLAEAAMARGQQAIRGAIKQATDAVREQEERLGFLPGLMSTTRGNMIDAAIAAGDFAGALALLVSWEDQWIDSATEGLGITGELVTEYERLIAASERLSKITQDEKRNRREAAKEARTHAENMNELETSMNRVPKQVKTKVEADTKPAKSEVITYNTWVKGQKVTISVGGDTSSAFASVQALMRYVQGLQVRVNFVGQWNVPGGQHGFRNFPGGLAVVGEAGPELVHLPRGSDVIPNNQLRSMTASGGGKAAATTIIQMGDVTIETDDAEGVVSGLENLSRARLNRAGL